MDFRHTLIEIGKAALIIAVIIFFGWLKWQQAKRFYERDLGDGGLQTLLKPPNKKAH